MITVRFPNGQAIQYNSANYVRRREHYSDLLTKQDGSWVAQVPNSCVIELVIPCPVYNPLKDFENAKIERLAKDIRSLTRKVHALTGKKK